MPTSSSSSTSPSSATATGGTSGNGRPAAATAGSRFRAELRRLGRLLRLALHLVVGLFIATSVWIHHRLTGSPRVAVAGASWWFARATRLLGLHPRVSGELPDRAVLLVANHISWLDIVVVGGLLRTNFVSKAEVRRWPLIGWMAHGGGTLFIPRGAGQAGAIAGAISERLAAGASVLVFPEGTTSDGARLRPFFPRLFAAARESGCTLQPVAIRYLPPEGHPEPTHPTAPYIDDDPFGAHLLRVLKEPSIEVAVHFCAPFPADGESDRKALARRARSAIAEALGEALEGPAGGGGAAGG